MVSFAKAFARNDNGYLVSVRVFNKAGEMVADLDADSRELWRFDNWVGTYYRKDGMMVFHAVCED